MATPKKLTLQQQIDQLMERFEEINDFFIRQVAERIRAIGELNATSMHQIAIMAQMNEDILAINRKIAQTAQMAVPDLYKVYQTALDDLYYDPRFERALKATPLSDTARAQLEHYVQSVSRQTAGTMQNLSNTTLVSQTYRHAVDTAILATSSGLMDYGAAMRGTIRDLGYGGIQVQYPSGYHKRLDSAVRQNIIDGTRQIAQHGSDIMGEDLGYDAKEISAHLRSAPDHEPIQGHIFLNAEYEKMQSEQPFQDIEGRQYAAIRRPIGQWNCMHFAMSFSTEYSRPKYTTAQLDDMIAANAKGCDIGDRHYTIYECGQMMRNIETQIRREKDAANAGRAAGDLTLRQDCQKRINALGKRYMTISEASGIKPRAERMKVAGFRPVKV